MWSTIGFFELPKGARGALLQYQSSKQNQWKAMGQVHHLKSASQFHLSLQWLILSCNLWWSEEIWYDLLPAFIIQKNGGSMRFGCWKSHQDPYHISLYIAEYRFPVSPVFCEISNSWTWQNTPETPHSQNCASQGCSWMTPALSSSWRCSETK